MLRITADIFSGRPNPQWIVAEDEARSILRSITDAPEVIELADPIALGLGYRGLRIEMVSDDLHHEMRLPASFRLLPKTPKGVEVVDRVLRTSTSTRLAVDFKGLKPEDLIKIVSAGNREPLTRPFRGPSVYDFDRLQRIIDLIMKWIKWLQKGGCKHEEIQFDPSFWNDPAHQYLNNCYNFASNRRTDTFAQPGRASGHMYTVINCDSVRAGAISDGAWQAPPCPPDDQAPRYLVALVIAPSWPDFHWYRRCSDGFWAHKPGGTAARNYDNLGHIIYDPETCDRGPYTVFCGYLYTQKKMVVQ